MTLAQRLMLAIGMLTIAATATVGFGVREAWRQAEERRFESQFQRAVDRLQGELRRELTSLPRGIEPLCLHDPMVDSAVIDLRMGRLDPGRRLSLAERTPGLMQSLRVDEVLLFADDGEILGAGDKVQVGRKDPRMARLARQPAQTRIRAGAPLAVESHCVRRSGQRLVGVYAARHVDVLLETLSATHGVQLAVGQGAAVSGEMVRQVSIPELGGMEISARKSRLPLAESLQKLDSTILVIGGATVGAALLLALMLSRGLARPIARLAEQAGQVVDGEPQPVKATGGKELVEFATAFNRTIADLSALRKRLAATERIAARREIARRVAHEIKNPLAPIRAAVETLRRLRARNDPAFDEYFDEATSTVLDEVRRINTIVGEFTRFARLPPPDPAPIDPVETVRKVITLHSAIPGPDLQLRAQPCPQINADADQLVQVVTNLVQNALDAVKDQADGGVVVEIRPAGPRHVCLEVRDNGPGVPEEIRERLFEPYATSKPHGTGLGLAIVQRIVVEHGGEISYCTLEEAGLTGSGARFTVNLPISGPTLLTEAPTLTPVQIPQPGQAGSA